MLQAAQAGSKDDDDDDGDVVAGFTPAAEWQIVVDAKNRLQKVL